MLFQSEFVFDRRRFLVDQKQSSFLTRGDDTLLHLVLKNAFRPEDDQEFAARTAIRIALAMPFRTLVTFAWKDGVRVTVNARSEVREVARQILEAETAPGNPWGRHVGLILLEPQPNIIPV